MVLVAARTGQPFFSRDILTCCGCLQVSVKKQVKSTVVGLYNNLRALAALPVVTAKPVAGYSANREAVARR